jgi:hypothetical protein
MGLYEIFEQKVFWSMWEFSEMFTGELLFQWASGSAKQKIQLIVCVWYKTDIIMSSNVIANYYTWLWSSILTITPDSGRVC